MDDVVKCRLQLTYIHCLVEKVREIKNKYTDDVVKCRLQLT